MDEATKRKTYFLLAATTIIWGIQPLCIKWLVTTWSPVTITAMRYYLIGTTLLALSVYRGEHLMPPRDPAATGEPVGEERRKRCRNGGRRHARDIACSRSVSSYRALSI